MVDIIHRVGMRSAALDGAMYAALTTIDGLSAWWTTDTTGDPERRRPARVPLPQGFDMVVLEQEPAGASCGEVVDGPGEWIRDDLRWGSGRAAGVRRPVRARGTGASRSSSCRTAAPSGRRSWSASSRLVETSRRLHPTTSRSPTGTPAGRRAGQLRVNPCGTQGTTRRQRARRRGSELRDSIGRTHTYHPRPDHPGPLDGILRHAVDADAACRERLQRRHVVETIATRRRPARTLRTLRVRRTVSPPPNQNASPSRLADDRYDVGLLPLASKSRRAQRVFPQVGDLLRGEGGAAHRPLQVVPVRRAEVVALKRSDARRAPSAVLPWMCLSGARHPRRASMTGEARLSLDRRDGHGLSILLGARVGRRRAARGVLAATGRAVAGARVRGRSVSARTRAAVRSRSARRSSCSSRAPGTSEWTGPPGG